MSAHCRWNLAWMAALVMAVVVVVVTVWASKSLIAAPYGTCEGETTKAGECINLADCLPYPNCHDDAYDCPDKSCASPWCEASKTERSMKYGTCYTKKGSKCKYCRFFFCKEDAFYDYRDEKGNCVNKRCTFYLPAPAACDPR